MPRAPVPYRPMFTRLVVALFLLLAFGSNAEAGEPISELLNQRRMEMRLLHLPIDRVVLGALPVFDAKTGKLTPAGAWQVVR